jgi:hypothetical protein
MTRIFIMRTIVARGKAGIKDSTASVLPGPLVPAGAAPEALVLPCVSPEAPVLAVYPLKPLVPGSVALEPPVRRYILPGLLLQPPMPPEAPALAVLLLKPLVPGFRNLEPPARRCTLPGLLVPGRGPLEALVLGFINLIKLLRLSKSIRSSPPIGARSQIAQSGRSGIILSGEIKVSSV